MARFLATYWQQSANAGQGGWIYPPDDGYVVGPNGHPEEGQARLLPGQDIDRFGGILAAHPRACDAQFAPVHARVDPAVDRNRLAGWIAAYEHAWRAPGTAPLEGIFTADAVYSQGPYEEPCRGLAAIERMWEAERDGPDEVFDMASEVVAVDGDTAVVRVRVRYGDPVRAGVPRSLGHAVRRGRALHGLRGVAVLA